MTDELDDDDAISVCEFEAGMAEALEVTVVDEEVVLVVVFGALLELVADGVPLLKKKIK